MATELAAVAEMKRATEALVDACGGWLPLAWRAWRKYTRRKVGKRRKSELAAAAAAPLRVAWEDPVAEGEAYGEDYSEAPEEEPEEEDEVIEVEARGPRMTAAEREAALADRALLRRRREASANYMLHQRQSTQTRERVAEGGDGPRPSKRFAWLDKQASSGRGRSDLATTSTLRTFPDLKCLEVATGATQSLFGFFAAAVVVVEFYLTDDVPRAREPPVGVDP